MFFALALRPHHALAQSTEQPTLAISTSYTVEDLSTVAVKSIFDVEGQAGASELTIPIHKGADNVSVALQDGATLAFELVENDRLLVTDVAAATDDRGWSFVVTYQAPLFTSFGTATVLEVAPLTYDSNILSQRLTIASDVQIGIPRLLGPEWTASAIVAGQDLYTWEVEGGAIDYTVGALYGEQSIADIHIQQTLTNDSWWWKTLRVIVPPDASQQQIFLQSVQPQPSQVRLDHDGNIVISYVLHPKQTIVAEVHAQAQVVANQRSASSGTAAGAIPEALLQHYTSLSNGWQEWVVESVSAVGEVGDDRALLSKLYARAQEHEVIGETAYNRAEQRAQVLVAAARDNNLPARIIVGKLFENESTGEVQNTARSHVWTEVYLPDSGWVVVDPSDQGPYLDEQLIDMRYLALGIRSVSPTIPMFPVDSTTVGYLNQETVDLEAYEPTIDATKYMILPGLAMQSITIRTADGSIIDNTGLQIGDQLRELGSLAPLQGVSLRSFAAASKAFSQESVTYGVLSANGVQDAMSTTMFTVNYLPMGIIGLLVIASMVTTVILRSRRSSGMLSEAALTSLSSGADTAGSMQTDTYDAVASSETDDGIIGSQVGRAATTTPTSYSRTRTPSRASTNENAPNTVYRRRRARRQKKLIQ